MHAEISPAGITMLLNALVKNRYLTDVQAGTMEPEIAEKIEKITSRNKAAPPTQQQPRLQTVASSTSANTNGKMITLWFKGQVHIGETPPAEPGWTRFTFDAGTQFSSGSGDGAKEILQTSNKATTPISTTTPLKAPASSITAPAATTAMKPSGSATSRPAAPVAATTKPQDKILFRVKAIYDYLEPDEDEVGFKAGDQIEILKIIDEDWYRGRVVRTGKVGQVPENHTEKI
jgi:hypothetical protein